MSRSSLRALLVIAASLDAASGLAGQYLYNASIHMKRLRADLLEKHDMWVPPMSTRNSTVSAAGTDVSVQIKFFKVESVSQADGQMRLKVWVRMEWVGASGPAVNHACIFPL